MSLYEFLLFVHILMAVTWVGGGIAIQVLAIRATRAKDPARTASLTADAEWMGLRVFMPASILLLIFGIWAASEGNWDFGQAWISIGFAAFLFSFFLGMAFLGPESGRIKQLVRERVLRGPRGPTPDRADPAVLADRAGRPARGDLGDGGQARPVARRTMRRPGSLRREVGPCVFTRACPARRRSPRAGRAGRPAPSRPR